jgi:hypothetical protein
MNKTVWMRGVLLVGIGLYGLGGAQAQEAAPGVPEASGRTEAREQEATFDTTARAISPCW